MALRMKALLFGSLSSNSASSLSTLNATTAVLGGLRSGLEVLLAIMDSSRLSAIGKSEADDQYLIHFRTGPPPPQASHLPDSSPCRYCGNKTTRRLGVSVVSPVLR